MTMKMTELKNHVENKMDDFYKHIVELDTEIAKKLVKEASQDNYYFEIDVEKHIDYEYPIVVIKVYAQGYYKERLFFKDVYQYDFSKTFDENIEIHDSSIEDEFRNWGYYQHFIEINK